MVWRHFAPRGRQVRKVLRARARLAYNCHVPAQVPTYFSTMLGFTSRGCHFVSSFCLRGKVSPFVGIQDCSSRLSTYNARDKTIESFSSSLLMVNKMNREHIHMYGLYSEEHRLMY